MRATPSATGVSRSGAGPSALTSADLEAVPDGVVARLGEARRVLTVCHHDPDADALGAAVGLALALETLGARVTPVCADPAPPMYAFLPGMDRLRGDPDPDLAYDLIVVGDCGDLARVGSLLDRHAGLFSRVPIVNIDHHASNPGFGAVDWVDAAAAATCELVTLLLPRLGVPLDVLDGRVATLLMAGVVFDTATFAHPNTTPRTLRAAAELRAAGAPLSDISRAIYRTKPAAQLRLFGIVLSRLETALEDRLAWSTLTSADLVAADASPAMSEGIIDLLAQTEGGEVAILFKEQGAQTRLSVRTRDGGVDAIALTAAFGGGGHARAAGATIEAPLAEARTRVLDLATSLLAARDGAS